ncbi:13220_t:CDS:1, partial [Dentiscutata erythropus]
ENQSLILDDVYKHWQISKNLPTTEIKENTSHYEDSFQSLLQDL